MGKILPNYKKAIYDEIIDNIQSNTSHYYVFASNPIAANGVPSVTNDDYSTMFFLNWQMLFGKKLANTNILPMVKKNIWTSNTVYDRYDNTSNTIFNSDNFYVISPTVSAGGIYHIYKCIDNANGASSTINPSSFGTPTQATTFKTSDGYQWRYISSISNQIFNDFINNIYAPVYPNTTIQASSLINSGVDVVMINSGGIDYSGYSNGVVKSVANSTLLQIQYDGKPDNFYTKSAIYIQNISETSSQLKNITQHISNGSGTWVYLDSPANTVSINPNVTTYKISPRVVFETDGTPPAAYSVVDAQVNSISSIVIIDPGSSISRANVYITSNTGYGANLYAIVAPPGGHGADPASELDMKGIGIKFAFANSEGNTIITSNTVYNKIGLLKNPYALEANGSKSTSRYTSNTFSQLLKANVSPSYTFSNGEVITGVSSNAKGTVVFSNGSQVFLTGDKHFTDGEAVINSSNVQVANITINTLGSIFATDVKPLYVQNINNVYRANNQTESFMLVIQI